MGIIQKAFIVPHPPIIVPGVGKGNELPARKTIDSYEKIGGIIGKLSPDVIIITSPHGTVYSDYIHISPGNMLYGDFRSFGSSIQKLEFENDLELAEAISRKANESGIEAGTMGSRDKMLDHGTLVPLFFISKYAHSFKLLRISISGHPSKELYRFGSCVAQAVNQTDRKVVFIASGDLSHKLSESGPYGFDPQGPEFDRKLVSIIEKSDFPELLSLDEDLCSNAGECGLRSFIMMAGALNGLEVKTTVYSYEGPFGVGYMVAELSPVGNSLERDYLRAHKEAHEKSVNIIRSNEDTYAALARLTLETYIRTGKQIDIPHETPQEMLDNKAGVFVSLKKHGQLRGCIGTISPVCENIAKEIIRNAIQSGTEDPRFNPVKDFELADLVYSVDVLGKPEPIKDFNELDVLRYGVIVTSGYKRGLLLPNLDGVTTPEQQVEIALSKAGIRKNESYSMQRFEVVRHK